MFSKLIFCVLLVDLACGKSLSRIINGVNTDTSAHPHQVSLRVGDWHICGGSIVRNDWIITAAHCVEGGMPSEYNIGVSSDGNKNNVAQYAVADIIMHPNYKDTSFSGAFPYDVALLKLQDSIPNAQPIALATQGQGFDGQTCTITGWGNTQTGGETVLPDQLQQASGTILPSLQCTLQWLFNYNHNVHICIHETSSGSCNGDSGGPMVCSNVLAGVTSWGASGCDTSQPSVYARVSTISQWAVGTMNSYL